MVPLDNKPVELCIKALLELCKESSDPPMEGTVIYKPQFGVSRSSGEKVDRRRMFDAKRLSHIDSTMEVYSIVYRCSEDDRFP